MNKFINTLSGKDFSPPPIWLMRQAGRYLPEYCEVRSHFPSFLEMCYTPEIAARLTLQPIERFGFDAAIIFSDILVIPDALGQKVEFIRGEGPQLYPLDTNRKDFGLNVDGAIERLKPIFDALRLTRQTLSAEVALIGFCGAPWTLAMYMLEGSSSQQFFKAKLYAYENPEEFNYLLYLLSELLSSFLIKQVHSGAEVIQIFDSWCGLVPFDKIEDWVIHPTTAIIKKVREVHPHVPIIGFPKGIGSNLREYVEKTKVTGVSLDSTFNPEKVVEILPSDVIIQGNLDPLSLIAGGAALKEAVEKIKTNFKGRPYIFNLGHGILPQTPIAHVHQLIELLKLET